MDGRSYQFVSVLSRLAGGLKRAFEPAQRINLEVPFAQKEQVKRLGARWDPQQRVWFISSKFDLDKFAPWIPGSPQHCGIRLYVPFAEKDEVRSLGASWDSEQRTWYVPPAMDTAPFTRWLKKKEEPAKQSSAAQLQDVVERKIVRGLRYYLQREDGCLTTGTPLDSLVEVREQAAEALEDDAYVVLTDNETGIVYEGAAILALQDTGA